MRLALVLAPLALVAACSLDATRITQIDLIGRVTTPTIATDQLGSDGDFSVGYANGNLRSNRVSFEWAANDAAAFLCYKVLRDGVLLGTIQSAAQNAFVDTLVAEDSEYRYTIGSFLENGLHSRAHADVKTARFDAPDSLAALILTVSSAELRWHNNADHLDEFLVERSDDGLEFAPVGTTGDTFYVDASVVDGTGYFYRVTVRSSFEDPDTSAAYFAWVEYDLDPPVFTSAQQSDGSRVVELQWSDESASERWFRVYRDLEGGDDQYDLIGSVPTDMTGYVDADTAAALVVGETYNYYLIASGELEDSASSDTLSVTIVDPDSVVANR